MYIGYERRTQPSKTPHRDWLANAFTESNAESLSSVINDHCYIIVKETDTCKHVNITKNKKILNTYNTGNYLSSCWNDIHQASKVQEVLSINRECIYQNKYHIREVGWCLFLNDNLEFSIWADNWRIRVLGWFLVRLTQWSLLYKSEKSQYYHLDFQP